MSGLRARISEITWRDTGDPRNVLWMFLVNNLIALHIWPARVRTQLLRLAGFRGVSPRAIVRGGTIFRSPYVEVGAGTLLGYRMVFDNRVPVRIGKNCGIGSHTQFLTGDHELGGPEKRSGKSFSKPITVGDGCRITSGVIIIRGVTIGDGVIVAAGSVVTKDLPSHAVYAGSPARKIRDLPH